MKIMIRYGGSLDADEFGPKDNTISQFLTELSDDIRVVGADVVNHFPTGKTILPQATTPW